MIYGSVCSGIESASVAWHPLGWRPAFFAEIDKFPSAVLAHHYPNTPNLGDFTRIEPKDHEPIDLLVGGTPCQSFSIAGLRGGLADGRGNLALEFLRLAQRARPRWLVWENVPGVLSSNGGRDFGAILGGMVECGYGVAYRVLDAQYVRVDGMERAVPQRRRRVFVVGYLGGWSRAAAVLFERASLSGDSPPRRETGERIAGPIAGCSNGGGANGPGRTADDAHSLITHALRADGFDASEDGTGRGAPIKAETFTLAIRGRGESHDLEYRQDGSANAILTPNGGRGGIGVGAVAFAENSRAEVRLEGGDGAVTAPLTTGGGKAGYSYPAIATAWAVRRLTPRECERLQGFPDDYTLIPWRNGMGPDGPRYKSLGNSMAVNVMRWIGLRIDMVERLTMGQAA